jgi:hypothetical protein
MGGLSLAMQAEWAGSRRLARPAALAGVLLLGLGLRLAPWGQNRFLEDEALYAYWGLQIATGADPMLDNEPVDKPPLHPYILASSFLLFGQSETAARLPSLFASVTSIALVYALGRELYRDERVGLLAAILLAVSPFDILFASTAFTDPLLVAWVLGALLGAAKGRNGAAGVLAGLAVATKQQGLFFLPLVVLVGMLRTADGRNERIERWRGRVWFLAGFAAITAGAIAWDAARLQRPGFFEQSLVSYGGLGPAQPQALGKRALKWLKLAGCFWASPWFNAVLVGAIAACLTRKSRLLTSLPLAKKPSVILRSASDEESPLDETEILRFAQNDEGGAHKLDLVLAAFVAGFLIVHWLVGFQVWDRYLLGLVPLSALLAARAFVAIGQAVRPLHWWRIYATGLGVVLLATMAGPVVQAARSEMPVGGDHGAYDGIDELAAYVRREAPPGSVLYHYWLGYHYRFYLYGAPLRLHWYPDLEDLAHDATVYRREPRYIAFPSWRDDEPAWSALAGAGIGLVPVFETTRRDGSVSFRLYRLEGP